MQNPCKVKSIELQLFFDVGMYVQNPIVFWCQKFVLDSPCSSLNKKKKEPDWAKEGHIKCPEEGYTESYIQL